MRLFFTNTLFLVAFISLPSAAEVYQWTDSSGKIHYSDRVPQDKSKLGHNRLNHYGQTVEEVGAEKTEEQLRIEAELARISAEKERKRKLQEAKDRALIVTFSDVSQLDKLRDERIQLLDSSIRVAKAKIKKIGAQLEEAENKKLRYSSKNRTVPKQLESNIAEYENQLANHYEHIALNKNRKKQILDQFTADRSRYLELQSRRRY